MTFPHQEMTLIVARYFANQSPESTLDQLVQDTSAQVLLFMTGATTSSLFLHPPSPLFTTAHGKNNPTWICKVNVPWTTLLIQLMQCHNVVHTH